ncbi:MerR family transcriptional regulator [Paenibacillus sp. MMO-177]|uniref:MerR family transcriptional regulator n=1 Tax=Paenibacillus sp. MMO-177 TaxID=3081289 RepID=UPI00301AF629
MFTIKQVSAMLDIPAVTLRAWEQRYGAVTPTRTDTGYRLFTEQDVEDLRWLKAMTEERGMSISQAVMLKKSQKSQKSNLFRLETHDSTVAGVNHDNHERTVKNLYDLLSAFQSQQAKALLDMGFSMFGYETMIIKVLVPLLIKVGDEWEAGRASVAQEHFITQFVTQRCYGFFQLFPFDETLPKVLAFCPSREQHHLGLMLFSLFLRQRGVEVLYLGPDTPESGIEQIIRDQRIEVVAISLSDQRLLSDTLALIDKLRERFANLSFSLGGRGFEGVNEPYNSWCQPGGNLGEWGNWVDRLLLARKPTVSESGS